jgi:hypothetical protein
MAINREWNTGDVITVSLPMTVSAVPLQNYTDYVAFKYGPILLGAKTGNDFLTGLYADESRMGHIAGGPQKDLYSAPLLIGDRNNLAAAVTETNADSLYFKINGYYNNSKFTDLVLQPFSTIHDSRYMMYWMNVNGEKWDAIKEILEAQEEEQQRLEARTIDYIVTGTQQSEADHFMQSEKTSSGSYNGEYYRDATGWFSYQMNTKGKTDSISLMVRYWGGDSNRKFYIQVDGTTIATVSLTGGSSTFVNKEYPIADSLLTGKNTITVKFVAVSGSIAGGIYYIRLCSGYGQRIKRAYTFINTDYGIGDAGRTSSITYGADANTLTLTQKSSGNNNISLQMKSSANAIYSILPSEYLFTIKGNTLSTSTGASYLWWMNGANHSSSVAPTYSITDTDKGSIIIWDLRSSGLVDNMDFNGTDEIVISNYDNSFINCLGLTSSSTTLTATISDINYYSPKEAVEKYPVLKQTLGINKIAADAKADNEIYNLNGQRINKNLLQHGIYIINGKKIIE